MASCAQAARPLGPPWTSRPRRVTARAPRGGALGWGAGVWDEWEPTMSFRFVERAAPRRSKEPIECAGSKGRALGNHFDDHLPVTGLDAAVPPVP
jgi:hypothetical protein